MCVCVCVRERETAPTYFHVFIVSYFLGGEVYHITSQHTATHRNTLQHTATHTGTFSHYRPGGETHHQASAVDTHVSVCMRERETAPTHFHGIIYSHIPHCNTLQHTATHQCVAVCIFTLPSERGGIPHHTATQCNTPRHTHIDFHITTWGRHIVGQVQ